MNSSTEQPQPQTQGEEKNKRRRRRSAAMAETSSSSRSSITNIAHDHIFSILQFLPTDSILSFSMTCKRFKAIASSDILWEIICRRDLGNSSVEGFLASSTDRRFSWKKLYQQVFNLGSVSCLRLSSQDGIFPRPRASHSLNFISECLVVFGGGYDEGKVCFHSLIFGFGFLGSVLCSLLCPLRSSACFFSGQIFFFFQWVPFID